VHLYGPQIEDWTVEIATPPARPCLRSGGAMGGQAEVPLLHRMEEVLDGVNYRLF
jgi:hypothetical protein